MTYQVLARKWRPQDFASLVGQDQIVTALRNALTEGRIAQAYLFSGIRGVGKTTAARVLAKALNCEQRTTGDPCNECPSCSEIGSGNTMDVIEVDAATYSKVEQVRELTETLRYGPAKSQYKVVVLDEIHRLSKQAFDALLKIVEEPPAHLVFIFATTEIDAVPATILSRCQEFQFRRVPSPVLSEHLRKICNAESIEVSDVGLRLIARAGEGSVRDSVALLDQMATFGSGVISDEDAKRLLGGLDSAIFQKLLEGILSGLHPPILEVVADIESNGWDPHNVYSQFLGFSRDALHLILGAKPETVELPEEECLALGKILKPFGYEALLQVLQLLIASEGMVRRSEFGLLALEIAWLRAAELPKVQKLQDFLAGKTPLPNIQPGPSSPGPSNPGPSNPGPSSPGRSVDPVPVEARSPDLPTRSVRGFEGSSESVPLDPRPLDPRSLDPRPDPKALDPGPLDPGRIPAVLEVLGTRRQSLAAHLRNATLAVQGSVLKIFPPDGDTLLERALDRPRNREALDQAMIEVWATAGSWVIKKGSPGPDDLGPGTSIKTTSSSALSEPQIEHRKKPMPKEAESPRNSPAVQKTPTTERKSKIRRTSKADLEAAANLPAVKSALEIFGGKIRSIEPLAPQPEETTP